MFMKCKNSVVFGIFLDFGLSMVFFLEKDHKAVAAFFKCDFKHSAIVFKTLPHLGPPISDNEHSPNVIFILNYATASFVIFLIVRKAKHKQINGNVKMFFLFIFFKYNNECRILFRPKNYFSVQEEKPI